MKRDRKRGFTLVEVIVVLVILAIMAAVLVPSFTGYFDKANKSAVLAECKLAVVSAQSLYSARNADPDKVTTGDIREAARVDGTVLSVEYDRSTATLLHLCYTNYGWKVTYCKNYETCPEHDELYTFEKWDGVVPAPTATPVPTATPTPAPTETPSPTPTPHTNTPNYFYIGGTDYKILTSGDINEYDFGPYGTNVPRGTLFYYNGEYYCIRDGSYYTSVGSFLSDVSSGKAVKLDISSLFMTLDSFSDITNAHPAYWIYPADPISTVSTGDFVFIMDTSTIYLYMAYSGSDAWAFTSSGWWYTVPYTVG